VQCIGTWLCCCCCSCCCSWQTVACCWCTDEQIHCETSTCLCKWKTGCTQGTAHEMFGWGPLLVDCKFGWLGWEMRDYNDVILSFW
jgi:hypothetical protein